MKKINILPKRIYKNSRHIRWNWEQCPDNKEFVRYQIVVVDNKNRQGIMDRFLEQLQRVSSGVELIRSFKGNVKNSRLKYLFSTYDSYVRPGVIQWEKVGKSIKRDYDLKERERGNIENYVARIYEE
jgi:hypothetical protein|tara:strand:- start:3746 stop:4126 length:381 start_codon:yes stop_codon:yes gene_type:complete